MQRTFAEMMILFSNTDLCEFFQIPNASQWIGIINPREVLSILSEAEDQNWQTRFCGFVSAEAYSVDYSSVVEIEAALDELDEIFVLVEEQPERVSSYLAGIDEQKKAKLLKALMSQLLLEDLIQV